VSTSNKPAANVLSSNGGAFAALGGTSRVAGELEVHLRKKYSTRGTFPFELNAKFKVPEGVTILLGHSGAGKTTILQCVAGLCDPEEGHIAIGGRVLFDGASKFSVEAARRKVAFVFQDLALFPHLTVGENVAYGLRKLDTQERERRTTTMMESFQIAHLRRRLPGEISGGEQQRVALARSLVLEPVALLLDEPLSSLDMRTKAGMIDDLRKWNEARRIPVLYVTHNHEEVFALGERVIALEHGSVVAEGSPLDMVPQPHRESLAQSADFENLFDATVVGFDQQNGIMTCRLGGTSLEVRAPLTRVAIGAKVRLGIRSSEILLSSAQPAILNACNVLAGRVTRVERDGNRLEAHVDCGVEFRVQVAPSSLEVPCEAWLIIRTGACHLVHTQSLRALQRLFIFVCNGNVSRSPMAQAICSAEAARRLGVPLAALVGRGIAVESAGLNARAGTPISDEAQRALHELGIPAFHHSSRNLTAGMVEQAEALFCMTGQEHSRAVEMFPWAASRIHRLHMEIEIADPRGRGQEAYFEVARTLETVIGRRLESLGLAEGK
jgi:molybdate transport system ATP-binding protein